jgi:hypothetical protein
MIPERQFMILKVGKIAPIIAISKAHLQRFIWQDGKEKEQDG